MDLVALQDRAKQGNFTSITGFSKAFARIFAKRLSSNASTFAEIMQQCSGRRPDTLSPAETELRAKARNILRATQPLLEDALRKESELTGRPFAQQMKELDEALISRRNSLNDTAMEDSIVIDSIENKPNGIGSPELHDVAMLDVDTQDDATGGVAVLMNGEPNTNRVKPHLPQAATPPASTNGVVVPQIDAEVSQQPVEPVVNGEPPTPPMSLEGQGSQSGPEGGIPWYVLKASAPCKMLTKIQVC